MAGTLQPFSVLRFTEDGCVWGSTRDELEELTLLQLKLAALQMQQAEQCRPSKVFDEGDWCLVHGQSVWRRGEVVTLLTGQLGKRAEIWLIDEGSQVTVPMSSCFTLPASVRDVPALVNCYSLKNVCPSKCDSTGEWGEEVMELLVGLNGTCTLDSLLEPGKLITLYLTTGGVERSFNECLIHADKASPTPAAQLPQSSTAESLPALPLVKKEARRSTTRKRRSEVYVEGGQGLLPWDSLEASSFPGSVQNGLLSLGFKSPTVAQAHAWPYVWHSHNVVLISPPSTGKTLSYLLPLLADIGPLTISEGPALLILVETSWQARSAHIQAKRILSWTSAQSPLRCCCTYAQVESEALVSLINGVDVLIGTPPSITRLLAKERLSLKHVCKLVLDDVCDLFAKFGDELTTIVSACRSPDVDQVILTGSDWTPLVPSLATTACPTPPVIILTSATEALVKCRTAMDVICCDSEERVSAVVDHLTRGNVVVCTSSPEEALEVQQVAQLHSCVCLNILSQRDCDKITATLASSGAVVVYDDQLGAVLAEGLSLQFILHYSLPHSKAVFQRRLALLYPSLYQCERCEWCVLLTEDDGGRAALLTDLLQRNSQIVPKALQDLAASHQQELGKLRSGYDLCYNLKAWGVCSVDKCPSPHAPSPHTPHTEHCPPPPRLPVSGTLEETKSKLSHSLCELLHFFHHFVMKVRVCHVSNATRLWVSVLSHRPDRRGGACVDVSHQTTSVSLPLKLSQFYSTADNKVLKYNVCEGVYCALENVDGSYHRVRVLKFSHPLGFCFPHKEKARVRLIDHGSVQVVDLNQLLELPVQFLVAPAAVVEVFLCGLRPIEKDRDWPQEAIQFSAGLLEGEVVVGRIAAQSHSCVWLDPVEHRVSLPRLNVTTALCNPVKELIKAGFGEKNPEHLSKVRAALNETSPPTPHVLCSSLPDGEVTAEVCVSAVSTPSLLYVQLVDNHSQYVVTSELDQLEDELNSCNILALTTACFSEGDYCAAQFPIDQRWYRGLIREKTESQCEVFFIDHGDTEWVENQLVEPIDHTLLELPAQAIVCSLTPTNMSWSKTNGDTLWDLTRDINFTAKVTDDSSSTLVVSLTYPTANTDLYTHFLEQTKAPSPAKPLVSVGLITELVTGLTESTATQLQFAILLECLMISNPKYVASNFQELSPLLTVLEAVETEAVVHVVKGLSAASQWLASCWKEMHWVVGLLKRDESQLMDYTIQLLKLSVLHARHELSDDIIDCLLSLLASPSVTVRTGIFDLLLFASHTSLMSRDGVSALTKVCCNCFLEGGGLSCLYLLDSLSMYEETAAIMRALLSPEALSSSKHILRILESLESGSIFVNVLWRLCSELSYREQLSACTWRAPLCHCFVTALFKAKLGIALDVTPNNQITKSCDSWSKDTLSVDRQSLICPRVLWSQTNSSLLLAVQLRDCRDVRVDFEDRGVAFRVKQEELMYGFDLTLPESISVKESGFVSTASEVLITLHKESCDLWPHLTHKLPPMFSTDFDRCNTESDEDESPVLQPAVPVRTHLFESSSSEGECSDDDTQDLI